jgi:prepilin-type N-terminal cleavage/methylation domain-containing protein
MRECRGLTLVELVVSAALFGLVAAAGAAVVGSAVRMAAAAKRWSEAEHHARSVVERMVTFLRLAGYGAGGQRLTVAEQSRVEFLADLSGDTAGPEAHGFYLGSDGVLRERSGGGTFPLSTQDEGLRVTSFRLAYFDAEGRELGPLPLDAEQAARVARVRIRATFRYRGLQHAVRDLAVEEHVAIRLAGE